MTANATGIQRLSAGQHVQTGPIGATCTGTDQSQHTQPPADQVRIDVVGGHGQHLSGATVAIVDGEGDSFLHVSCDAPSLSIKLPTGTYQAQVTLPNAAPQTVAFDVSPGTGHDIIVRFPSQTAGMPADRRKGRG